MLVFHQNRVRVLRMYLAWAIIILTLFLAIEHENKIRLAILAIALVFGAGLTLSQQYIVLEEDALITREGRGKRVIPRQVVLDARAYRSLREAKRGERVRTRTFIVPGGPCLVVRLRPGRAKARWPFDHKDGDRLILFPQEPRDVAAAITAWAAVPEDASPPRPRPA